MTACIQWNPDFSNLRGKRKLVRDGSRPEVGEIESRNVVFDYGRKTTFGSSYREFEEYRVKM